MTKGLDVHALIASLPTKSGVYRMINGDGQVLYVGKARNLRNRVASYFQKTGLSKKTRVLVQKTCDVQVTITSSEAEALLLEQSFIKQDRPAYNVILRDDKSYPFIRFSEHEYPRIHLHRGSTRRGGSYFGPYPSATAVRESVGIIQKLFRLRICDDSYFKNRSRPCLQHQIGRCSAPCVNAITKDNYRADLRLARLFLQGKSEDVLNEFKAKMNRASESLEFENAAVLRDQLHQLVKVQQQQYAYTSSGAIDVWGIAQNERYACVQGIFIRDGRLLGHRTWYPSNELDSNDDELLAAFLAQYYLGGMTRDYPKDVLTSVPLDDADLFASALSTQSGRKIKFAHRGIKQRAKWLEMVRENTAQSLNQYSAQKKNVFQRLLDLHDRLELDEVPKRLECFDISHSSGEAAVASCVVFDTNGPVKSEYRKFNIGDIAAGDDYGALSQAVKRRYDRIQREEGNFPDLVVIDGGRNQLKVAQDVLKELQLLDIDVLSISKGEGRRPEFDTVWIGSMRQAKIPVNSGGFHLIQHIRDEAHRFALTAHRNRRAKRRRQSELDTIEGIGAARKRSLLTHFGSVNVVKGASVEELEKVPGVSTNLARTIFDTFHG